MEEIQSSTSVPNERSPLIATPEDEIHVFVWVVPVRISANGKQLDTFALIDSGCNGNFIAKEAATFLDLKGFAFPSCALTLAGASCLMPKLVKFSLSSRCGTFSELVIGFSRSDLTVMKGQVDPVALKKWNHLKDIDIESTIEQKVSVVIGICVADAHRVYETILPPDGVGPRAIRTNFGWIAVGGEQSYRLSTKPVTICQRIQAFCTSFQRSIAFTALKWSPPQTLFCFVPIQLSANGKRFDTMAFIDSGSMGNYIEQKCADALELQGPRGIVKFSTPTAGVCGVDKVRIVHVTLGSRNGSYSEPMTAFVVADVKPSVTGLADSIALKKRWNHLKDIDIESTIGQEMNVLIGIGVAGAHQVLETVLPPDGVSGPRAILTPFGWIAVGDAGDYISSLKDFYDMRSTCCCNVL